MADPLVVRDDCRIPLHELEWRFTTSGGPGGQHANKAATRAEVRFDVEGSRALSSAQRRRLRRKLGSVVVVAVDETRSQARNRELALERLRDRLAEALREPRRRRPTRPSRAAKERRLEQKRRRSERKRQRRPPREW